MFTSSNIPCPGLPQVQEKWGKTEKKYKSQVKMGVFEKSLENSGSLTIF